MRSRVPEEFPPLARAFAVLLLVLLGAGHDGDGGGEDEEDEDGGLSVRSNGTR